MLKAANLVLTRGYVKLAEAFRIAFPNIKYHSRAAKSKLLRMPLVALRVGEPAGGNSEVYLFELSPNVEYSHVLKLLNQLHQKSKDSNVSISKSELKDILQLATSSRERECIRYTVWKTSGLSATAMRKQFGVENINRRAQDVESCIEEVRSIRESIDNLTKLQEQAACKSCRYWSSDSSGEDEATDTSDSVCEETEFSPAPSDDFILHILRESQMNWYYLITQLEDSSPLPVDIESLEERLNTILTNLQPDEQKLLIQSHSSFKAEAATDTHYSTDEIVSESDDDHPDDYLGISSTHSEAARSIVQKKIEYIRRKAKRDKAKAVAQTNFLCRKQSRRLGTVLEQYPDIGSVIEQFVESRNIGADAWRRTGVLTFDGNRKVHNKVTYEAIRQHVQEVYGRSFGYGTIVQLCVVRNKRRLSAKRYKGVARVTSRRARKGFQLKFNPDSHWSATLYKGLNVLQYTNGKNILNLNRDDAAGFRLDTLSTHRLHRTPVVKGKEVLTTRTDFVNSYPSILQTSSYLFSRTENTGEMCAGVVKGAGVYPKNPAQHLADLEMLEKSEAIRPVFLNPDSGMPKPIECVRVDGGSDEGPSHVEVQFWWTMRHFTRPTYLTLITTRNSGSSYLNRVELLNGCIALAHANTFIPSNLNGTCFDPESGKVDNERLKINMELATDAYISRVNGCPCGDCNVHFFKGADSSSYQEVRDDVLNYIKSSRKKRKEMLSQDPGRFSMIKEVCDIREHHMVKGLPSQYIYQLVCCHKPGCTHPFCKEGMWKNQTPRWYPSGPKLSYLPFPVIDSKRPWGDKSCEKCTSSECTGHFQSPQDAYSNHCSVGGSCPMTSPPSSLIKIENSKLKDDSPPSDVVNSTAKRCLLSISETKMWFDHLQTVHINRKRGAEKAKATRSKKKTQSSDTFCGVCGVLYEEQTESVEHWIGCDKCSTWFHYVCVGIDLSAEPSTFHCKSCLF